MWYRKLTILDFETPLAATAESTRDDTVTARGGRGHRVLRRAVTAADSAYSAAVTAAVTAPPPAVTAATARVNRVKGTR